MKEELTTSMHADFVVSEETDLKHRVWVLLSECERRNLKPSDLAPVYGLSSADIEKYKQSYLENK